MVASNRTTVITDQVLCEARARASLATTRVEVADAVSGALSSAGVPRYRVTLEDYKLLVTEAMRANRAAGRSVARTI